MDTYTRPAGGVPPYGYTWNVKTKHLEINKFERNILLLVFKYSLKDNLSPHFIAKKLNELHLHPSRKGKQWTYKSVSYLFKPDRIEFYSGYKKEQKGNWDPIITPEMATELKNKNVITISGPRPRKNKYLLSGTNVMFCGYCGGHVKSASFKKSNYYYCSNRSIYGSGDCPKSAMLIQDEIDNIVLTNLKYQLQNIEKVKVWTNLLYKKREKNINTSLPKIDNDIKKVLTLLNKVSSSSGLKNPQNKIADLINKKTRLLDEKLDYFDFRLLLEAKNIETKPIDEQRTIVTSIIKKILVTPGKAAIEYPFVISAKGDQIYVSK